MREDTFEHEGKTVHARFFSDWLDLLSRAEYVQTNHRHGELNGLGCASINEGADFTGTDTMQEAIDLARRGWPEGVARIKRLRNELNIRRLMPQAMAPLPWYDVDGDEPHIERYLSNMPENMMTHGQHQVRQAGKIVRIVINRAALSGVSTDKTFNRGLGLWLAIEALSILGYATEVTICFCSLASYNSRAVDYVQMPFLHPGDSFNLDSLAFWLMHASVFRRFVFAVRETEKPDLREELGAYANVGGYGESTDIQFLEQDVYVEWREGLVTCANDAVFFAFDLLKRAGIEVPEEVIEDRREKLGLASKERDSVLNEIPF